MNKYPFETRVATARHRPGSFDREEYESLPARQRAQRREAIELPDRIQERFRGGMTADA